MVVCRWGVTIMMIDSVTVVMYINIIVVTDGWVGVGICIDTWAFVAGSSVGVVTSGVLHGRWRVMNNKGRHVLMVCPCIAVIIAVSNTIVNTTTIITIATTNMVSITISVCVDDGYVLLKQLILLLDVCMCL